MVVDTIENLINYESLNENISKVVAFLQSNPPVPSAGRYELDGENLFYFVNEYETTEGGNFEAHKTYLDLQLIVSGNERLDYAPYKEGRIVEAYDDARDILFLTVERYTPVKLKAGSFALLFPQDAHRPGKTDGESVAVKKFVFKLKA